MIARLVLDAVRRYRWFYLGSGAMLLSMSHLLGADGPMRFSIDVRAISLILATTSGPMFAILAGLRALRHLPVTRRDIWCMTWVLATIVPAGVLLASKALHALLAMAVGGRPPLSVEAMLLSAVYDVSWTGMLLPVMTFLALAEHAPDDRGGVARVVAEAGRFVGFIGCFALPVVLSEHLPSRVDQFTPITTVMLIACIGLAYGALVWTPRRGVLVGERGRAQRPESSARPESRPGLADRLSGTSRVLVPHLLMMALLIVGTCLALASFGVLVGSGPWWLVPESPTVFDPADIGDRGLTYFVLMPCAIVVLQGVWSPWARLLKVLPLSVRQINALLVLTPFATCAVVWILGVAAYVLAYGVPSTLRVEFAFGMASMAAFAHAGLLRVQGSTGYIWTVALTGALLPQVAQLGLGDGSDDRAVFMIVGVIALGTAAIVNHHTLTRATSSSTAYAPLRLKALKG